MHILIVGGGLSGLAAAAALADRGHQIAVAERHSGQQELGSGITLTAPAIRALFALGVYDQCLASGRTVTQIRENNVRGEELRTLTLPSATGEGGAGILGMMRSDLHRVLTDRAKRAGATIRQGNGVTTIDDRGDHVKVTFNDGSSTETELVIGADGLRSIVREQVFGHFEIIFRHQGCFRAVVPRPREIEYETDFSGHPGTHPGFTPLSESEMYVYCTAAAMDSSLVPQNELPARMRELLKPFGGVMEQVSATIVDPTKVNYRPFETLLVPRPWNRGRVVLIGDSAHSTTPHLAAGGAMCFEDALVLAEELALGSLFDSLDRFTERRFDRARFVVETSVMLARWQLEVEAPDRDPSGLKVKARKLLAQAY